MPNYRPLPYPKEKVSGDPDVRGLLGEFTPYAPDRTYVFGGPFRDPSYWEFVTPKAAPPVVGNLPEIIQNLVKATWKFAEPKGDAVAGKSGIVIGRHTLPPAFPQKSNLAGTSGVVMGQRGMPGFQPTTMNKQYVPRPLDTKYHPEQQPTKTKLVVDFPDNSAIARDWDLFKDIKRVNAVTFRGDGRPPAKVIVEAHGFHPPISRINDKDYLEKDIYEEFKDYLKRRYERDNLTKENFLAAVRTTAPTPAAQKLLADYMRWRQITCREAAHLGRMVSNEFLKGYISTSKNMDTSMRFATGIAADSRRVGWLYVTEIHSGFVVPETMNINDSRYWASGEGELAHWGPVPADQIVGFVKVDKDDIRPTGPIFMRPSFSVREPEAFEVIFKLMSGMSPSSMHNPTTSSNAPFTASNTPNQATSGTPLKGRSSNAPLTASNTPNQTPLKGRK